VGTKVLWPGKRGIGILYGRMLLHDMMLKDDSYRTGTAESPLCECGEDKESVPHKAHILLQCNRFVEARSELEDSVEDIIRCAKSYCFSLDKAVFINAPLCSNNVSKKDNIVFETVFQFISRSGMKL